jgi:Fe-S-cluster containining protein
MTTKLGSEEMYEKGVQVITEAEDKKALIEVQKQEACLKCLKCCKEFAVALHPINFTVEVRDINTEFFLTRGFGLVKDVKNNIVYLEMPNHPCPQLTENGCNMYENRPVVCRNYDGRRDFEDCLWHKIEGI